LRRTALSLLSLLFFLLPAAGGGQEGGELVDRVVALVDEDPILLSDLRRAIGLGMVTAGQDEPQSSLERRALDALIEWRIRFHEIARFGFEQAPLDEVEAQLERLRARFPTDAEWRAELDRLALDEPQVRQILARQLAVLAYVELRLGPRVFVGVDEIQRHYDEKLVPELRAAGEPVPPIEEVRESIRALLREQKLNEEIDRWTRELRRKADVVDLLEVDERPAPPAVLTLEPAPPR